MGKGGRRRVFFSSPETGHCADLAKTCVQPAPRVLCTFNSQVFSRRRPNSRWYKNVLSTPERKVGLPYHCPISDKIHKRFKQNPNKQKSLFSLRAFHNYAHFFGTHFKILLFNHVCFDLLFFKNRNLAVPVSDLFPRIRTIPTID